MLLPRFIIQRKRFYNRCQEIVDDLHKRVEMGNFVGEADCKKLYGNADYCAFLHQIRRENTNVDYRTMTPAMEWMYASRYFKYKASAETRQYWSFIITIMATIAAIASAFYAGLASGNNTPASPDKDYKCNVCKYENKTHQNIKSIPFGQI